MMFNVWLEKRRAELRSLIRSYEERRKPSDRRWIESKLEAYDEIVREVDRRNWVVGVSMPFDDSGVSATRPGREGILNALRQLRRAVEEAGHGNEPRIAEAMEQATIVLGRGY